MAVDGYRCDTCSRPGVRVRPIPGVGRTDPSVAIGSGLGVCGRLGCAGELRAIPVDDADRELREALVEAGVLADPTAARGYEGDAARARENDSVNRIDHVVVVPPGPEGPREPEPV